MTVFLSAVCSIPTPNHQPKPDGSFALLGQ